MNAYLPTIIEAVVLLTIFLLATGLARPLRRSVRTDAQSSPKIVVALRNLAGYLARPLLILLITPLMVLLLKNEPHAAAWLDSNANHVLAWEMFWACVLVVMLCEGCARQIYLVRGLRFPIPDLLLDILRALVMLGIAFVVLKVELGINIAPLLASTAVITAVVGFALQGVLGNLLAGLSLHITGSIKQGDWVNLGDVEGRVKRTNWRETRLVTINGHEMIIPNSKVSGAVIHNMNHPSPRRRHALNVGASYSDAPDEVIAALEEAAESVPEVLPKPRPEAILTSYEDFGINYRLRYWSNQYHRRRWLDGQVGRMIWYKFKRRGIEIPFPMSDVLLNDFMAVIYNQRKLDPQDTELSARVEDLEASRFHTELCVDESGQPLLGRADYERVVPLLRRHLYTSGETLFAQGDEGNTLYVVISGRLTGRIDHGEGDGDAGAAGDAATTFELGPGSVLGEMSLLTGLPRTATITVTESADLLEFGPDAFREVLELHERVPEALAGLAARRADQNRAALEELQRRHSDGAEIALDRGGILKRFWRMLGR